MCDDFPDRMFGVTEKNYSVSGMIVLWTYNDYSMYRYETF